jgi:RHS repeat-associated protein
MSEPTQALPQEGARQHRFGYDPEGNLTSVQENYAVNNTAASRQYALTYDSRDRVTSVTDANGKTVRYDYDAANNLTKLTDSAAKETSYGYDAKNRLVTVQMTGNRLATYAWKADGLLDKVTYPSGVLCEYNYDDADRLTSVKNSINATDNEEFVYSYDKNSNREKETRKQNNQTYRSFAYGYDELNRLHATSYEDASGKGLVGEYYNNRDFSGLALTRVDGQVNFNWQGSQTPAAAVQDDTFAVRWTGRIEADHSEEYTFYVESDESAKLWVNGQLVVDDSSDHTSHEATGTIRLEAGRKYDIKLEYSENTGDASVKLSWSSSSQGKQVVPQSKLSPAMFYEYDAAGNRQSERGWSFNASFVNRTYQYNDLNRLTSVTGDAAGVISFTHDANGNLKQQTQGSVVTNFEYDTRDQLRRVLNGTNEVARFDYDFERKRLSKSTASENLSYVYSGNSVINEYNSANQLVNRYDHGMDLLRSELGSEGERFYLHDGQGSVTSLATVSGSTASLASRYEYDAWGVMFNAPTTSANRVGYTGQRFDSETGLMVLSNGERFYDAALGQFIQQDSVTGSLANPQSLNRHSYVTNNPLGYTDPTGHEGQSKLDQIIDWGKQKVDDSKKWASEKMDELAEFLMPGVTKNEGYLNFKAFVRGAYHGAKNAILEIPALAYDLGNRLLGADAKTRSMTVSQYDGYRDKNQDPLTAGINTLGDVMFGIITLGAGPAIISAIELTQAKAAGK